MIFLRKLPILI